MAATNSASTTRIPALITTAQPRLPILLLVVAGVLIPAILAYALATMNAVVVLAAVLGLLGALVILARPFWGLICFTALVYTRPEDLFPALQGTQFTLLISVLTLAGMWLKLFLQSEKAVRTPLIGMLLGFVLMTVISTISGGDPVGAALTVGKLVAMVLLILNLVRTPQQFRIYTGVLIVLSVYLAVFAAYQYYSGEVVVTGEGDRAIGTGVFGDPNDLAAVIVAGLALTLSRLPNSRTGYRLIYLLISGVMLWCIFLTQSRGAMLATLIVVNGTLLIHIRRKYLAIPLIVVAYLLLASLGSGRMTNFDSKEASANARFWFWDNGIAQLARNPLTGVGYGMFTAENSGRAAHNSFVIAFTETGLPGYFFWMGCLYYAFRRRAAIRDECSPEKRRFPDLTGAKMALAGYLSAVFFLSHTYLPTMYLLMSLPVAAQLSTDRASHIQMLSSQERFRDSLYIAALCVGSIVFIKLMVLRLG